MSDESISVPSGQEGVEDERPGPSLSGESQDSLLEPTGEPDANFGGQQEADTQSTETPSTDRFSSAAISDETPPRYPEQYDTTLLVCLDHDSENYVPRRLWSTFGRREEIKEELGRDINNLQHEISNENDEDKRQLLNSELKKNRDYYNRNYFTKKHHPSLVPRRSSPLKNQLWPTPAGFRLIDWDEEWDLTQDEHQQSEVLHAEPCSATSDAVESGAGAHQETGTAGESSDGPAVTAASNGADCSVGRLAPSHKQHDQQPNKHIKAQKQQLLDDKAKQLGLRTAQEQLDFLNSFKKEAANRYDDNEAAWRDKERSWIMERNNYMKKNDDLATKYGQVLEENESLKIDGEYKEKYAARMEEAEDSLEKLNAEMEKLREKNATLEAQAKKYSSQIADEEAEKLFDNLERLLRNLKMKASAAKERMESHKQSRKQSRSEGRSKQREQEMEAYARSLAADTEEWWKQKLADRERLRPILTVGHAS